MLEPKLLEQIIDVAAFAAYKSSLLKGKGDKNTADQAAVDATVSYTHLTLPTMDSV